MIGNVLYMHYDALICRRTVTLIVANAVADDHSLGVVLYLESIQIISDYTRGEWK